MDNPEKLATSRRQTKQRHNTICVGRHYAQTNTNNINKTTLHCCRYDNDTTVLGRKLIFKFELTDNSSYQGKFI